MRRIVILAIVLGIAVVLPASGSSSPRTAKVVLRSMRHAALAQTSVHWGQNLFVVGKWHRRWISDVGTDSGYQVGILTSPVVGGKVREMLVDNTVYIKGNAAGLEDATDLSADQATPYEGQWISVPQDDELYPELSDGLTLRSIVDDETPYGPLKLVTRTVNGKLFLVVRARPEDGRYFAASLAAPAKGKPLPARYQERRGRHEWLLGSFTNWNEPITVTAPETSVPIATVRGD
ncbi:MAG TPA: hypothetical protein VGH79_01985 [Gaiellaceae bacterium]|jgi:hypothetical protein